MLFCRSTHTDSSRRRVKLDLSLVPEFAVFPGQIIVVEGNNTTGTCLVAHKIFCDASLPMQQTPEAQIALFNENEGELVLTLFIHHSDRS